MLLTRTNTVGHPILLQLLGIINTAIQCEQTECIRCLKLYN